MTALANRRDLSLEDLHVLVGAPLSSGAVTLRRNGPLLEAAWPETLGGGTGWAWSLSLGPRLISQGWTGGNRRDRDGEIRRAVAEYRERSAS